jgi:acyl carrier protein
MTQQELQQQIQTWLEQQFMADFKDEAQKNADLFEAGVIDSFGQVELVGYLEKTFSIHFTDEELMSSDMASLTGMATLVQRKVG